MKKRVLLEDIQGNELYPRPCMPIGSVIFLNNALDPNTYFMGTWEKIEEEVFFMTASSSYPVGQISGSNTHTLTIDEMPAHTHPVKDRVYNVEFGRNDGGNGSRNPIGGTGMSHGVVEASSVGGNQPFDVRPKRYTVNAWVRIS